MPDDPVARILGLVAEGWLIPRRRRASSTPWTGPPGSRRDGAAATMSPPASDRPERPATSLRIQVLDTGRPVVNLRVPLSLGRAALDRVPGALRRHLGSIREAIKAGITGPILDIDEGNDGVRISIE